MDVTNDATISKTARDLADAVGALSRALTGKSPYVPRVLELESNRLTHWIRITRPDLFPKYYDDLSWIAREAKRLCGQRSSESPSDRWWLEYFPFSKRSLYFRNFLRELAAHIDGRSGGQGSNTLTQSLSPEATVGDGRAKRKKKRGRPRHSKERYIKAVAFCRNQKVSGQTLPEYCRDMGIKPAEGKRMRDFVRQRQKPATNPVNNK